MQIFYDIVHIYGSGRHILLLRLLEGAYTIIAVAGRGLRLLRLLEGAYDYCGCWKGLSI